MLLAIACIALYGMKLSGAWRWIYALTALVSLYLNVFVLVIQCSSRCRRCTALAPGVPPAEPPFAVVQGIVLVFFVDRDHRRDQAIPAHVDIRLIAATRSLPFRVHANARVRNAA